MSFFPTPLLSVDVQEAEGACKSFKKKRSRKRERETSKKKQRRRTEAGDQRFQNGGAGYLIDRDNRGPVVGIRGEAVPTQGTGTRPLPLTPGPPRTSNYHQ